MHDLRRQVERGHDVAAHVQVEELIGPAQLDVRLEEHRVVGLHQRVQELVQRNRLARVVPLAEVAPFEHLRDVIARRQPNPVVTRHRAEPAAVEVHHGLHGVEQLEHLPLVGLGVRVDGLACERRPGLGSAGRVADEAGEIADQKDHRMAKVLEVLHLANEHGVAEVQIWRGRIEPHFHDQRPPRLLRPIELALQVVAADDVHAAFGEVGQLLVYGHGSKPGTRASRLSLAPRPASQPAPGPG